MTSFSYNYVCYVVLSASVVLGVKRHGSTIDNTIAYWLHQFGAYIGIILGIYYLSDSSNSITSHDALDFIGLWLLSIVATFEWQIWQGSTWPYRLIQYILGPSNVLVKVLLEMPTPLQRSRLPKLYARPHTFLLCLGFVALIHVLGTDILCVFSVLQKWWMWIQWCRGISWATLILSIFELNFVFNTSLAIFLYQQSAPQRFLAMIWCGVNIILGMIIIYIAHYSLVSAWSIYFCWLAVDL